MAWLLQMQPCPAGLCPCRLGSRGAATFSSARYRPLPCRQVAGVGPYDVQASLKSIMNGGLGETFNLLLRTLWGLVVRGRGNGLPTACSTQGGEVDYAAHMLADGTCGGASQAPHNPRDGLHHTGQEGDLAQQHPWLAPRESGPRKPAHPVA